MIFEAFTLKVDAFCGKLKLNILITGGAGFIGANFIHYLFNKASHDGIKFTGNVINVDNLTYAADISNLNPIEKEYGGRRYFFEKADICDRKSIEEIFAKYNIDTVVHFAAESHVDRSITEPDAFIKTNVMGTYTLLDVARNYWTNKDGLLRNGVLFHHISTDEVYGALGENGFFTEETSYCPRSPYSASKASADHIALSYFNTYGLPVTVSNCSNNYGPFQHKEKFIPHMITSMVQGKPLTVYGTGKNVRDWIYVMDHCAAIWLIMNKGQPGQKYNVGGENEMSNIDLLHKIIRITSSITGNNISNYESLISFVKDRAGHDFRYAVNCSKIKNELGWKQKMPFDQGLTETVKWYLK